MAETAKDTVYKPHSTPKSYTNYSGLELPEVNMKAETFLKPLLRMGTSSDPVHIKTDGVPLIDVHATTALTTGTEYVAKFKLTQSVETAVTKLAAVYAEIASAVKTGDHITAFKGAIDYSGGGNAAGGQASVISGDMIMQPGAQIGGAYYLLNLWIAATAGFVHGANDSYTTSYINCGVWGTAKGEIDDHAFFIRLDGFTVGATHMISLTSQTVKCILPTTTTRYMVMSQMEDGLGLGVTGTHMVLTDAATRAVDIYTDYSGTGPSWAINIDSTMGTTGVRGGVMYSCLTVDAVVPGSYIMNTFIKADYASVLTTAGFGMGAGLMVELVNPTDGSGGGEFHVLALEWTGATADTMHGNAGIPSSFIKFEGYGTAEADIDDHGYLFYLSGFSAADHHLVDNSNTNIDFIADVLIKINIGGTEYWLGACDNEAGTA